MVSKTLVTAVVAVVAIPVGYLLYSTLLSVNLGDSFAFTIAVVVMMGMAAILPGFLAD
ncbi:hypothetical protein [Haladaptatus caseinilyticus]|uniref:hypothetical protein n=1 Tax=Haladaptatus caseinilyticus TaxID=2993314 RepID=UPI00224A7186|nr:hypothetical protein [Haladaptatus caseinilyticus]